MNKTNTMLGKKLMMALMMGNILADNIPFYKRIRTGGSGKRSWFSPTHKRFQGEREKARRLRQIERGILQPW